MHRHNAKKSRPVTSTLSRTAVSRRISNKQQARLAQISSRNSHAIPALAVALPTSPVRCVCAAALQDSPNRTRRLQLKSSGANATSLRRRVSLSVAERRGQGRKLQALCSDEHESEFLVKRRTRGPEGVSENWDGEGREAVSFVARDQWGH